MKNLDYVQLLLLREKEGDQGRGGDAGQMTLEGAKILRKKNVRH